MSNITITRERIKTMEALATKAGMSLDSIGKPWYPYERPRLFRVYLTDGGILDANHPLTEKAPEHAWLSSLWTVDDSKLDAWIHLTKAALEIIAHGGTEEDAAAQDAADRKFYSSPEGKAARIEELNARRAAEAAAMAERRAAMAKNNEIIARVTSVAKAAGVNGNAWTSRDCSRVRFYFKPENLPAEDRPWEIAYYKSGNVSYSSVRDFSTGKMHSIAHSRAGAYAGAEAYVDGTGLHFDGSPEVATWLEQRDSVHAVIEAWNSDLPVEFLVEAAKAIAAPEPVNA